MAFGKRASGGSDPEAGPVSRRSFVLSGIAGFVALGTRSLQAQARGAPQEGEEAEIARVEKMAQAAGIGPFRTVRKEHFLSLGDSPASFQRDALARCEELGQAFLTHFRTRGFKVDYPPRRLTIIALKDESSYAALLGEAPGKDVGGHFDLETNRLVIFDFRPQATGTRDRRRAREPVHARA